ncbi:hypothetical protein JTB14_004038 [Gonioctena quinquepunctata]|nr:hypothetical protein JTB14_004038 [Gonioctena quinquepunctata]
MQPVDVAVYGPFKARYKVALNNWLISNPGKTVSLYGVAGSVNAAYSESILIHNICKSFLKTGIYPLNSSIFTEDDFLASSVTDWPNPCNEETQEQDIQDKKCNDLPEVKGLDIVSQSTSSADLNTESKPSNSCSEKAKVSAKKTKKNIKLPKVPRNDNDSDTAISWEISLHDESPKPANLEIFYDEMVQQNKDDSVCPICQGKYQDSKKSGSSVNFARNGLTTLVEFRKVEFLLS